MGGSAKRKHKETFVVHTIGGGKDIVRDFSGKVCFLSVAITSTRLSYTASTECTGNKMDGEKLLAHIFPVYKTALNFYFN